MATLPRVRQIEETLRQAQVDPRLTSVICMMAERQRVQHEQILQLAQNFNAMQDLVSQLIGKMGVRDGHLKKLGIEEMLKDSGVRVESVDEFDADTTATNEMERKGN